MKIAPSGRLLVRQQLLCRKPIRRCPLDTQLQPEFNLFQFCFWLRACSGFLWICWLRCWSRTSPVFDKRCSYLAGWLAAHFAALIIFLDDAADAIAIVIGFWASLLIKCWYRDDNVAMINSLCHLRLEPASIVGSLLRLFCHLVIVPPPCLDHDR